MKRLFHVLAVMLVLSYASALSINAPAEIPANTNWSFSVALDAQGSFTKTSIYINDIEIATVFGDGQTLTDKRYVSSANVFFSGSSMTLYLSNLGVAEGSYSVNAKNFNGSEVSAEQSATVQAFKPLGEASKEELREEIRGDISQLETDVQNLIGHSATAKTGIEALRADLDSLQGISEKIDSLSGQVSDIDDSMQSLEGKYDSLEEGVSPLLEERQARLDAEASSPIAGLSSFATSIPVIPILLAIVVIAVIAGAFMVVSRRGTSLYFGNKRINELDSFTIKSSKEEEEMAKELSDGKWAAKK